MRWKFWQNEEPRPEPKIVAAVMTASGPSPLVRDWSKAKAVEEAMAREINRCLADGIDINDSVTIKVRMMQARERVLEDWGR